MDMNGTIGLEDHYGIVTLMGFFFGDTSLGATGVWVPYLHMRLRGYAATRVHAGSTLPVLDYGAPVGSRGY